VVEAQAPPLRDARVPGGAAACLVRKWCSCSRV